VKPLGLFILAVGIVILTSCGSDQQVVEPPSPTPTFTFTPSLTSMPTPTPTSTPTPTPTPIPDTVLPTNPPPELEWTTGIWQGEFIWEEPLAYKGKFLLEVVLGWGKGPYVILRGPFPIFVSSSFGYWHSFNKMGDCQINQRWVGAVIATADEDNYLSEGYEPFTELRIISYSFSADRLEIVFGPVVPPSENIINYDDNTILDRLPSGEVYSPNFSGRLILQPTGGEYHIPIETQFIPQNTFGDKFWGSGYLSKFSDVPFYPFCE